MTDPHESYNPNFPEEDWRAYQTDVRANNLADRIKVIIDTGRVAVIRHSVLCDLNFDIKSRVDYPAPSLQMGYYPHWAALALAMLTHACFEHFYEEGVTRFYKSPSVNPIMYPPNVEFVWKDIDGREYRVPQWIGTQKAEKMKQLDMFEF
jgi:hypothetical protein